MRVNDDPIMPEPNTQSCHNVMALRRRRSSRRKEEDDDDDEMTEGVAKVQYRLNNSFP